MTGTVAQDAWPELSYARLQPTAGTLHLWTQVVGKVAVARLPWLNHSWHVALHITARGLVTPLIPCGAMALQLEFDFLAHELVVRTTEGRERRIPLTAGPVAGFYRHTMDALTALGAPTQIVDRPNELPDATPFPDDRTSRPYDPQAARDLWLAFVQMARVFGRFRTRFLGKSSPLHFFWGGAG